MADALTHLLLTTLGEVAGASAEGWLDGRVGGHPVCEGVFAVLDDTVEYSVRKEPCREPKLDLRLTGLIPVIGFTGLAWGDWSIINKLQKMLSETSNDGKLLAVLLDGIKLVSESCL